VLELHLINVGTARADAFERNRFQSAKLCDGRFELRLLLPGNIGKARTHHFVLRLPKPEFLDVTA